jgi:hypothetical protein
MIMIMIYPRLIFPSRSALNVLFQQQQKAADERNNAFTRMSLLTARTSTRTQSNANRTKRTVPTRTHNAPAQHSQNQTTTPNNENLEPHNQSFMDYQQSNILWLPAGRCNGIWQCLTNFKVRSVLFLHYVRNLHPINKHIPLRKRTGLYT